MTPYYEEKIYKWIYASNLSIQYGVLEMVIATPV